MSDNIRESQNWNEALRWVKAESERLGCIVYKVKEDLKNKTIEGQIAMVKSKTTREDGITDFVFYVDPVYTFKIFGPSSVSDVSAHVLRGDEWFRVYHENYFDTVKTYPMRKVLWLKDPKDIKQHGFGSKSIRTGYCFDWWIHFLKREADDFPDDEVRLEEIRGLMNLVHIPNNKIREKI
jgi:hypothetical protein